MSTSFGPCHLCGSETQERHGVWLLGCCPIEGSTQTATVEVCGICLLKVASGTSPPCPLTPSEVRGPDME